MARRQLAFDFGADKTPPPSRLLSPDEIYQLASQVVLADIEERDTYERKPAGIHAPKLAEWICMFANSAPLGGLIAVGIADSGEFVGCVGLDEAAVNRIQKAGREHCPDARYEVKRVPVSNVQGNDDFVLLFRVYYRDDKVVETTRGDAFIRRGDSKFRLSHDEKRELAIDKGQVSLEEEPCALSFPGDFNVTALKEFTSNVVAFKKLAGNQSSEQILSSHHLGKRKGVEFIPNVACALLFAEDPNSVIPGSRIRFQRYEGVERLTGEARNVVRDEWFDGRLPEIIASADSAIQAQIRTFSRLGKDGRFSTAPEYPRAAWYEALVNACVHRSYNLKNMYVWVRMFDDRLEIESPGSFPIGVSPKNIYEVHHRRNYFLMDSMFYLGLVKGENEGTRRMRDEMLSLELPPPEFGEEIKADVSHTVVRVTLRNNANQRRAWMEKDAAQLVGEAMFARLSDNERRCVNYAAEYGAIKAADVVRITEIKTWQTAKKLLDGLSDDGILEYRSRFLRDPKSHYRLKSTADPS